MREIFIGGVLLFISGIWLVRNQITVTGTDYMEGVIPHHSIAILTSERAQIEDPGFWNWQKKSSDRREGKSKRWSG